MRYLLALLLVVPGCSSHEHDLDVTAPWDELTELEASLPAGVRVFALADERAPLRAWCVRADLDTGGVVGRVVVSADRDRKETASEFAEELGAFVVVNGGFFARSKAVATHQGLLYVDGRLLQGTRDRNPALGFDASGRPDIAWSTEQDGTIVELPHGRLRPGQPVRPPKHVETTPWAVRDAVQAKPPLVLDGIAYELDDVERHPRTAAGITATGELVLVVVDGRQRASCGVTLAELAELMLELGCVEALNLDGGGSSTLVVAGQRLNLPQGRDEEREVMSAIALVPGP